jgi:hypothetical protein
MVYSEILNQLKAKGASSSNKISSSSLPEQLRPYLTKEYLINNKYYNSIKDLVYDTPMIGVAEHVFGKGMFDFSASASQRAKFKLPVDGVGGLPGQKDLLEELKVIPDKIAAKLRDNTTDVTVNVSGVDANVAVEHTLINLLQVFQRHPLMRLRRVILSGEKKEDNNIVRLIFRKE